ncbi:hypothetical protein SAMN05444064_11339 [Pseudomonas syringae]|nr:hypothetical protein SAMN05444514_11239 [Pseudomonas syringae]SFM29230.1 hypothetical protein SAMN05444064_11339 [Pseudomonas syringae]
MAAMGCEAVLKQVNPVVPDIPHAPGLLSVPDSSRTSEASPGPLPHHAFLPGGRRSGLVRDGLRSGPETGHLGCVWYTEATGSAAGSRQFADKSAPTARPLLQKPAVLGQAKRRPVRSHTTRFCPEGVGADLSAMGCEAALKPVTLAVSGTPRRLVLLPVPGSSRTSPLPQPGPSYKSRQFSDKRSVARSAPTQAKRRPVCSLA